MSYANGTQFYDLPQTVGTDKRDWFDTNAPFAAIDADLHAAVTGQASDAEAISTINSKLAADEADIATLQTASSSHAASISALQTTVSGQANQIADVRQDAEDMISAYNEGAAETSTHAYAIGDYFIYNDVLYKATAAIAIGDTIVPNTNCQATNVTTQIKTLESATNKIGDLADLTTTDKSSTVAAINEVKSDLDDTDNNMQSLIKATSTAWSIASINSGETIAVRVDIDRTSVPSTIYTLIGALADTINNNHVLECSISIYHGSFDRLWLFVTNHHSATLTNVSGVLYAYWSKFAFD